jgi:hypothetical protein
MMRYAVVLHCAVIPILVLTLSVHFVQFAHGFGAEVENTGMTTTGKFINATWVSDHCTGERVTPLWTNAISMFEVCCQVTTADSIQIDAIPAMSGMGFSVTLLYNSGSPDCLAPPENRSSRTTSAYTELYGRWSSLNYHIKVLE